MTFPWLDFGEQELKRGTLPRMAASGFNFVSLTLALDAESLEQTVRMIAHERACFRDHSNDYVFVESIDDILRAKAKGKLAVGFHFQGTNSLAGDLNMIEVYYRLGIRHMLMAYNLKNLVGDGCLEPGNGGLSRFGASMVKEMNRVGMIVDCSHTSDRTSMDVFEVSTDPVIISHSPVRALCDRRRNVPDELITACAQTGGVIGLHGFGRDLTELADDEGVTVADLVAMDVFEVSTDPVIISHSPVRALCDRRRNVPDELITACAQTGGVIGLHGFGRDLTELADDEGVTVADLVAHIDYVADLVGPRHVGIGLDYIYDHSWQPTPWHPPDWWTWGPYPDISPEQLPELTEALIARGYEETDIRGILGENWLRIAKQVWK